MIFHFVKIMDDLELFNKKTPKIRFDDDILLGQFLKYYTKNMGGIISPKMSKNWNSRKLRYEKTMNF